MKTPLVISLVATLAGTASAAPEDVLLELARQPVIDPTTAAKRLGVSIISTEQVSPYRREYQLGTNASFTDITAIVGGVGGTWRVIDLVPRPEALLTIAQFAGPLADARYVPRPFIKHTPDGPVIAAVDHHFVVAAGELVIRTPPHSAAVERITLTTARTIR